MIKINLVQSRTKNDEYLKMVPEFYIRKSQPRKQNNKNLSKITEKLYKGY